MTVFVPASAALLLLILPLVMPTSLAAAHLRATFVLLGVVSYGFPFATVKTIVTRVALNTLKEFAALSPVAPSEDDSV